MTNAIDVSAPARAGDAQLTLDELRQTLDDVGHCIWSLDVPTGQVTISSTCSRLFGVPAERLTTFAACQALVHPEDRQARFDAIRRALGEGGGYEVDFRVVQPDGGFRWLRSRGRVRLDARGEPARHSGVILGIDEQKRAEADLRAREAHMQSILDTVPEAMVVIDAGG